MIGRCGLEQSVNFEWLDDLHRSFVAGVHQSVAVLIAELPVDFDVWIQAYDASTPVQVVKWHVPLVGCAVLQVGWITLGVDEVAVLLLYGQRSVSVLIVSTCRPVTVALIMVAFVAGSSFVAPSFVVTPIAVWFSAAAVVAVAFFPCRTLVLAVMGRVWAVVIASAWAMSQWFLDTVVSQSHFALPAIVSRIVDRRVPRSGNALLGLEAAKLWHWYFVGVCHCC